MKRYNQLTEPELLALTDDEILYLIDYECALDGVSLLPPHPGPKPEKLTTSSKTTVYEIAGYYVLDSEHAARILAAFNSGKVFRTSYPNSDYYTKYLAPTEGPKIETSQVFSPEEWDSVKSEYLSYSSRLAEYTEKEEAYNKALKDRTDIAEDVHFVVQKARNRAYKLESLQAEFKRYLDLAEGNPQIAYAFLNKVHDLVDFPELNPGPAIVSGLTPGPVIIHE